MLGLENGPIIYSIRGNKEIQLRMETGGKVVKFEVSNRPDKEIMCECRREQLTNENNKVDTNKWARKRKKYNETNGSATIEVTNRREAVPSMTQEAIK